MEIQVRPLTMFEGSDWEVQMNRVRVKFRSESEARNYAQTLQARLDAAPQLTSVADEQTVQNDA